MQLQLIDGIFSHNEVIDIITKLIQVKIDFHENKISNNDSEEDIKHREYKIKFLQNSLKQFKEHLKKKDKIELNGIVSVM